MQYTIALQDLHCRTCTPHTLLCDTTHCITTLHYTTVHTAVHSPHTTPPHGESDLPVGRSTVTDTTADTTAHTTAHTTADTSWGAETGLWAVHTYTP